MCDFGWWDNVTCRSPFSLTSVEDFDIAFFKISDVISQLFPTISDSKLSVFSCGHVIPASNLKSIVITKGPSGKELTFRYKDRSDESLVSLTYHLKTDIKNSWSSIAPRTSSVSHQHCECEQPHFNNYLLQYLHIIQIVPNGLVIFLPSYAFLNTVKAKWSENGVLSRMQKKKRVSTPCPNISMIYPFICNRYTTSLRKAAR